MSDSAIKHAAGVFAPGHLGELTRIIPFEMVDAALETAGGREQRVRRLPSRVVVYLLLAGALFTGMGWRQVWSRLAAGLADPARCPSGSALTEAMRRVGPAPFRELFTLVSGPAITCARQAAQFAGRLVVAIDGTQVAVPDTAANRARWPKPRGGPNGQPGYPMIRLVTIVAAGTRSVLEAVFGTDTLGELTYADRAADALGSGMILLGDRNFATAKFFTRVTGTGADFLIRTKTGSTAMKLPAARRLADGSYLSYAGGIRVRVIDADVTISAAGRTRTSGYRLVTTLLEPAEAPAAALLRLYHQRWEIETAYCELKSQLLHGRVLRSKHPAAIEQELWAYLTTYQALRTAMTDAALHQPQIDPDRMSFTIALHTARDQIIQAAGIITETTTDLIGRIGAQLLDNLMPTRRQRTRARVIKRAISKYRAKGRHVDHHTYPAIVTVTVLTPKPDT